MVNPIFGTRETVRHGLCIFLKTFVRIKQSIAILSYNSQLFWLRHYKVFTAECNFHHHRINKPKLMASSLYFYQSTFQRIQRFATVDPFVVCYLHFWYVCSWMYYIFNRRPKTLRLRKHFALNESCTAIASVKNNERCFDVFNVG
jgi:hypothetical protein